MRTEQEHDGFRRANLDGRDHPLDNPVWAALTGSQARLAEGSQLARRYPVTIAPFAAMGAVSPLAYAALRALIPKDSQVALFLPHALEEPSGLAFVGAWPVLQMVAADLRSGTRDASGLVELGTSDVLDMVRLAEATKPGPFAARTSELGRYLGVRAGGELVAMAGERMRFDGHVEISAVCVHPDYRGRGYAQRLVSALVRSAAEESTSCFLHVFADNMPAIAIYEHLGFEVRRTMYVTRLRNAGT